MHTFFEQSTWGKTINYSMSHKNLIFLIQNDHVIKSLKQLWTPWIHAEMKYKEKDKILNKNKRTFKN